MNPFAALVSILIGIYVNIVILRFFLQYFRADFYNPLSQFVVKVTDPLILPLRKIIPGIGGLDMSSLVLAWLVTIAKIFLVTFLDGESLNLSVSKILLLPLYDVVLGAITLFMFLIFIRAILSWFSHGGYNPIFAVIGQLTEPLISKCRRLLPATGGIDFSPIIALIALWFISQLLNYYIYQPFLA